LKETPTPAAIAKIAVVGSIDTRSETWLWSWGNFHFAAAMRTPLEVVRDYGEEKQFLPLITPLWHAEEVDGWEMAGLAAQILKAKGVYRTPSEHGLLFMVILEIAGACRSLPE
jgi:hypothetical protein